MGNLNLHLLRRHSNGMGWTGYLVIIMYYNYFWNYLTKRTEAVVADEVKSPFQVVDKGVPQDSILGPLLFTLYINYVGTDLDCVGSRYNVFLLTIYMCDFDSFCNFAWYALLIVPYRRSN